MPDYKETVSSGHSRTDVRRDSQQLGQHTYKHTRLVQAQVRPNLSTDMGGRRKILPLALGWSAIVSC